MASTPTRTDRDRAEALASLIYDGASLLLWADGAGVQRVLLYRGSLDEGSTIGSGDTAAEAWSVAMRVLRARAIALGDDLARELGAP